MSRYRDADLEFEAPDGWRRRVVPVFVVPPDGRFAASVVMTRDVLAPRETLRQYADRQQAQVSRRLARFALRRRRAVRVAGVPAVELAYGWIDEVLALEQRLLMLATRARVVLNFTATAPVDEAPALWPLVDRCFASIRLPRSMLPVGARRPPPARGPWDD